MTKLQLKMLERESVKWELNEIANQASRGLPVLNNDPAPYDLGRAPQNAVSLRDDIVIVTSRFRSGSTFLWNIFRQAGGFTSYYEPFNERRWFDEAFRGDRVDSTHRGVDDYWSEFNGLGELGQYYNEDWIRHRMFMGGEEHDPDMQAYIECMVERAPQRPVLQFNRIDLRLGWMKTRFPNAKLLHLYRHPRDQWCSFLTDKKLMNKHDVHNTYIDGFYLDIWCDDLAIHYPFLDKRRTPHPYQRFYYLWKLSYLFGRKYSDLSFSFEELTRQPESCLTNMFSLLGVDNPPMDKLLGMIQPPEPDKWREWAEPEWFESLEQECEQQLDMYLASHPHFQC